MPLVIVNDYVSHAVAGSVAPGKDAFLSIYTCIRYVY
jgi:hypothetical protein